MFAQVNPLSTAAASSSDAPSPGNVNVPVALLLDDRLTPLERNAWMVFRARVGEDGTSALPNYEQMRPFLACKVNNQKAAYETASRTVCVLRMTRWIHMAGHRRDPLTGQVLNTLYAVHNSPQSCLDVCRADPEYIELVERSIRHANHVVRAVAVSVLNELAAQKDLPTALRQRIDSARVQSGLGGDDDHDDAPPPPADETSTVTTHDESTSITSNADSAVRTYKYSFKVRTYRAREYEGRAPSSPPLVLPQCLSRMAPDQHRDVQAALKRLPSEHQQAVLDELEARVQLGSVRNVVAYLFGLLKRVMSGEFRLWAGRKDSAPAPVNPQAGSPSTARPLDPPVPTQQPAAPEVARAYLARARRIMGVPAHAGDLAAELLLGTDGPGPLPA